MRRPWFVGEGHGPPATYPLPQTSAGGACPSPTNGFSARGHFVGRLPCPVGDDACIVPGAYRPPQTPRADASIGPYKQFVRARLFRCAFAVVCRAGDFARRTLGKSKKREMPIFRRKCTMCYLQFQLVCDKLFTSFILNDLPLLVCAVGRPHSYSSKGSFYFIIIDISLLLNHSRARSWLYPYPFSQVYRTPACPTAPMPFLLGHRISRWISSGLRISLLAWLCKEKYRFLRPRAFTRRCGPVCGRPAA